MENRDPLERTRAIAPSAIRLQSDGLAQNKALVRRYVEEVWNRRKISKAREMLAPTFVYHCASTQRDYPGFAGLEEVLTRYFDAFPDHRAEIRDMHAERDMVSVRLAVTATFERPFLGFAPTGQTRVVSALVLFRVAGGRIADEWGQDSVAARLKGAGQMLA